MGYPPKNLARARARMVEEQLAKRGIDDPRVLEAMAEIPRHFFVDEDLWDSAYRDGPLPIGYGQTISQPYIVAFMTQLLRLPPNRQGIVLEIGTGSGYQAAVLSWLAGQVYSIERIPVLAGRARTILDDLGITNVKIRVGDGGYGWPEHGPYHGIITTAAAPQVPAPLTTQLEEGGVLLAPIGPRRHQELVRLEWRNGRLIRDRLAPVAFVPLIGEHGWEDDEAN